MVTYDLGSKPTSHTTGVSSDKPCDITKIIIIFNKADIVSKDGYILLIK